MASNTKVGKGETKTETAAPPANPPAKPENIPAAVVGAAIAAAVASKATVDDGTEKDKIPTWIADAIHLADGDATAARLDGLHQWQLTHGKAEGAPWGGQVKGESVLSPADTVCRVYAVKTGYIVLSDGSRVVTTSGPYMGRRYWHVHTANTFRSQARMGLLSDRDSLSKRLAGVASTLGNILADIGHLPVSILPDPALPNLKQALANVGNAGQIVAGLPADVKFPSAPPKGTVVFVPNPGDKVALKPGKAGRYGEAEGRTYIFRTLKGEKYVILPPDMGKNPDAFPMTVDRADVCAAPQAAPIAA